jgi:type VI secretion system secreted protein VgrG
VSGQTTSLYTHSGGIKAITANGMLSLRAHTEAQQIWTDQDLTIQSTTDEVRIQASNSITLSAGQSQIVIKGGDITFCCPGTWTVKGATHAWEGGGSGHAELAALPSAGVHIEPSTMVIERRYHDAEPMAGTPYEAVLSDGSVRRGVLNGAGSTEITGVPLGAVADVRFGQMPGAYEPKDQRPMPAHNPAPSAADIDALLDKYSGGQA